MSSEPRIVEVRERVWKQNDMLARELRREFRRAGVHVVSLVSSRGIRQDGSSRTIAHALTPHLSCWSSCRRSGDGQRRGAASAQWGAGEADHDRHHLPSRRRHGFDSSLGVDTSRLRYPVIENVGNLVCPSSYDLGESLRMVALSVTEGEDKPLKYPTIFNSADIAVITKMDLADAVEFDFEVAQRNIRAACPSMEIYRVSAKTGAGLEDLLQRISQRERPARTAG